MTAAPEIHAVILAGGSGTRFWPASRAARPKQFLPIAGGRTMIRETWDRLQGLVPPERVLVVTVASQAAAVCEALPELDPTNVLAEPQGRNTAPCVALAAYEIARRSPDAVQVVLPADHVIRPAEAFRETVAAAAEEAAAEDVLITFGIEPTFPATGYGWVERGAELHRRRGHAVHAVERFVEKPDRERAEGFVASGKMLWNSGMFVWSTAAILAAYRRHLPEVARGLDELDAGAALEDVYAAFPSLPVDVGILERADNVRMLAIDYSWSDVGSWAALPEVLAADARGNCAALPPEAILVAEDATDCVVYAEGAEVVALVGVKDLVVVRSGRATLVCPRDRAQEVRRVVERLRERGSPEL